MTGYQQRSKPIKADHKKIKRNWQTNKKRKAEKEREKTNHTVIHKIDHVQLGM